MLVGKIYKKIAILIITSSFCSSCAVLAVGAVATVAGVGTAVATDPRTSGTVVNDNTIVAKLSSKLSSSNYPNANIYVSCYNGVVLLTGEIKNKKDLDSVLFDTKSTPGVKQIYNYLDIRLPHSFTTSTSDSYITTEIKTKLISYDDIHSNNIKVVTTNSVVYLLGVVSKPEGQHISSVVASVNGVTKVITLFEYKQ
jgi:osmotically-inducible protein OsmY